MQVDGVLQTIVERTYPGARLLGVQPFAIDAAVEAGFATKKAAGYGEPLRLHVELADGSEKQLVFHTQHADEFGHDRRADRAQQMLLAFDTFGLIPEHVKAVDVGAISQDGAALTSLQAYAEFYLITEYQPGTLYADDLRGLAHESELTLAAEERCATLARYLARLHQGKISDAGRYVRSIRDTVGSGEGIFGILDSFAADVPGAPRAVLERLEVLAVAKRREVRNRQHRLARIHGDFHPFNIVFRTDGSLALLDASRGCVGDPADDVSALVINFVFFALEQPAAWVRVYRPLWRHFWETYLQATGDDELLSVVALFLGWRGLVVANPVWYPGVSASGRERMLALIERSMAAPRFDIDWADQLFP